MRGDRSFMSNNPKNTVVDLSKLVKKPGPQILRTSSNNSKVNTSKLLTICNESTNMIGHEQFTLNEGKKKGK